MQLYMSGTPSNDVFQIIENQICSHRLLSMHKSYASGVFNWLDTIKSGVRTVDDYLKGKPGLRRLLKNDDLQMRARLAEQGSKEEWTPYADTLRQVSAARPANYPRHIMLDSGAFTAWNSGGHVSLDQVKRVYADFLDRADGLFDEVWLINLDEIPGAGGREATPEEKARAMEVSDANLAALRAEFGDCVLPVFHQGESKDRFIEILQQSKGYICLSPQNGLPEDRRWRWTKLASSALYDLEFDVRTHGLATTGNEMIRRALLYSGDSAAWRQHGGFGVVDLVTDRRKAAEKVSLHPFRDEWLDREIVEWREPCYTAYHIGRERNDFDRKSGDALIDNARHYTRLPAEEQAWVRERVEQHIPFLLAQLDQRARALVCMAELQAFAASEGKPLTFNVDITVKVDGRLVDPEPFYGKKVVPGQVVTDEARDRFMARELYDLL